MRIFLVGLNHKSASLEARESLARIPIQEFLIKLKAAGLGEVVLVSTCNRFELYAVPAEGRDAAWALRFLEESAGRPIEAFAYSRQGASAVRHLFEVAAGLDSLVVGETEILGQVKSAYESALAAGATGKATNVLFQRALYVGKKVRHETAIAMGATSAASVSVQLAASIFGTLEGCPVLILGTGAMAESAAQHLRSQKASLIISGRRPERAEELARRFQGRAIPWDGFGEALERVDVVVASTASPEPILTKEIVARATARRAGRSLFIIDIAMPRDVEEAVHGLDHVYLYRLEDLEAIVARNLQSRSQDIAHARAIVGQKASEFEQWIDSVAQGREISLKHSPAAVS